MDIGYQIRHDIGTEALGILKYLIEHPDNNFGYILSERTIADVKNMIARWEATLTDPLAPEGKKP